MFILYMHLEISCVNIHVLCMCVHICFYLHTLHGPNLVPGKKSPHFDYKGLGSEILSGLVSVALFFLTICEDSSWH